ncbi:MAG: nicotinate-nucleotide--dimethylbenzimidazole phosphoribosyltransferase [Alphaproteobacteria bacterium]|jgi:nicotinate-nucleotide--dimethylbenzimidazole phosphoribosyltransferase
MSEIGNTPETVTFAEIRALLDELPGPDAEAFQAAVARDRELTKPAGALGRLEELAFWLAGWQGRQPPRVDHPRVAVFAGNHGVAARGVSAYPPAVTAQMVQNFVAGGAAVNQLTAMVDGDLRVYEMALEAPTADFTQGPAMDEETCARAMAYGMMAVEQGIDLLALGEMGIGNTTAAAAICHALYGGEAADWTGPGTGVEGAVRAAKTEAVAAAVVANRGDLADPLQVLRCLGGQELAAIAGAVLAARLARIPVLLDGYACCAAAAVLHAIDDSLLDHCRIAHLSAEPAHAALAERLGQVPLLDLGMRLGEASGAALAIPIVRAAALCHADMATFADAGVSGPA